ncbi:mavicyanin-like [Prunus yedoensis var. nudiflora]|uniref:Mavicyanin-like n=1 Tax=Prunus yedoensis var. nudiflora TaxID=2094558 RepID=A0A314YKJ8_PRUYE|nr:mavicyanin-like [Prunus yedoensis var. nudiflora]
MASEKSTLIFLVMLALCGVCFGAVYRVGDSSGWSSGGLVDYNEWTSTKDFHVGDTLLFSYNNQFHNVMQVTNQDYESCNPTSPIAVYTSGSDNITLDGPGNFYFLCGAPGHCQAGQRVEITATVPTPDDSFISPSLTPYGSSDSEERSSSSAMHFIFRNFSWVLPCLWFLLFRDLYFRDV